MDTARPSDRLGRSAALVQAIVLLSAACAIAIVLSGAASREATALVIMFCIAVTVLLGWSLLLAFRACWRGERLRWPLLVTLAFAIEATAASAAFWLLDGFDWSSLVSTRIVAMGLPLFVPYAASLTVCGPLALGIRAGATPRGRAAFCVALCMVLLCAAVTLVALPLPMFLFCSHPCAEDKPQPWKKTVCDAMPDFVRDTAEAIVHHQPVKTRGRQVASQREQWDDWILRQGWVSDARLVERVGPRSCPFTYYLAANLADNMPASRLNSLWLAVLELPVKPPERTTRRNFVRCVNVVTMRTNSLDVLRACLEHPDVAAAALASFDREPKGMPEKLRMALMEEIAPLQDAEDQRVQLEALRLLKRLN